MDEPHVELPGFKNVILVTGRTIGCQRAFHDDPLPKVLEGLENEAHAPYWYPGAMKSGVP